jgi:hypothetical protein
MAGNRAGGGTVTPGDDSTERIRYDKGGQRRIDAIDPARVADLYRVPNFQI